jgi:dTDP-4-amino-4,6-dideoxygalactose transaminase
VCLRDPSQREAFVAKLAAAGVETLIHYPHALPDQPAAERSWRGGETCLNARALARSVVSLPLYPDLTEEQSGWVAESVLRALR